MKTSFPGYRIVRLVMLLGIIFLILFTNGSGTFLPHTLGILLFPAIAPYLYELFLGKIEAEHPLFYGLSMTAFMTIVSVMNMEHITGLWIAFILLNMVFAVGSLGLFFSTLNKPKKPASPNVQHLQELNKEIQNYQEKIQNISQKITQTQNYLSIENHKLSRLKPEGKTYRLSFEIKEALEKTFNNQKLILSFYKSAQQSFIEEREHLIAQHSSQKVLAFLNQVDHFNDIHQFESDAFEYSLKKDIKQVQSKLDKLDGEMRSLASEISSDLKEELHSTINRLKIQGMELA